MLRKIFDNVIKHFFNSDPVKPDLNFYYWYNTYFNWGKGVPKMKLSISLPGISETLGKEFEQQIMALQDASIEKVSTCGFDGISTIIYFIVAGGGGAAIIYALEKIIVSYIKRDDVKSIKIGDVEIKGYSQSDVTKMLKRISEESASAPSQAH